MKAKLFRVCLTSLLLLMVVSTSLFAAGWTVQVLTPNGFTSSSVADVSGGQQVGSFYGPSTANQRHAVLWSGTPASWVDLNPAGWTNSSALGTSGSQQVGFASDPIRSQHAGLWSGTAESWVDLHPSAASASVAHAAWGDQQVGYVMFSPNGTLKDHASLWNGTAGSWVDLHPEGYGNSRAEGVWNGQQIGRADNYAVLWSGTAESRVFLNPEASCNARAFGIRDGHQVGYATYVIGSYIDPYGDEIEQYETHAGMWSGTASSWLSLHPAGFSTSVAKDVCGGWQAGYVAGNATVGREHASLWNGTADSWVDLHSMLPQGYARSWGEAVDVSGGVVTVVGYAIRSTDYRTADAFLWTYTPDIVPEPSSFVALGSGLLGLYGVLRRRRA